MELFTFDDVLIEPKFSFVRSRKDVDPHTKVLGMSFNVPVISSNMDTITTPLMAKHMLFNGAAACLHRFQSIGENCVQFQDSVASTGLPKPRKPFVSIGLGPKELDRARTLVEAGAEIIVIDVAHGANIAVVEQYVALREAFGDNIGIIVGNFATAKSIRDFNHHSPYNLEAVKVGIGNGAACTTRVKTGVGVPQLSAIMDCAREGLTVIGDGGCKTAGDIVKSIAAGASAVMLGRMLAGAKETPEWEPYLQWNPGLQKQDMGYTLTDKKTSISVKLYRGSASGMSYEVQGKKAEWRAAEGEAYEVPRQGSVVDILNDINGGLRSAMSYVGASNIHEFREAVEFQRVTNPTIRENGAHGK